MGIIQARCTVRVVPDLFLDTGTTIGGTSSQLITATSSSHTLVGGVVIRRRWKRRESFASMRHASLHHQGWPVDVS